MLNNCVLCIFGFSVSKLSRNQFTGVVLHDWSFCRLGKLEFCVPGIISTRKIGKSSLHCSVPFSHVPLVTFFVISGLSIPKRQTQVLKILALQVAVS